MDDEIAELRNPFPSPPSHYTKYTTQNLKLLALLKERAGDEQEPSQHTVLNDQHDLPDWPLIQLEKPRVDWILDEKDAYYEVFGDRWFVKDKIPSLEELGGHQLYPSDPSIDRRPALQAVLRSVLVTYSSLMGSLLAPPPINPEIPPDWQHHVEWINVLSQNLMAAANDLRPIQAREHLETMMKRQLQLRREETRMIHEKCDSLSTKLAELRASIQASLTEPELKSTGPSKSRVDSASKQLNRIRTRQATYRKTMFLSGQSKYSHREKKHTFLDD
ncbi:MED7 protein-domain-containing protein [Crepidotus variabilis]|uniref:Mediator of RNA polymerase II transcription subunit 7 n=1 Tax=Crepidotus variabilis TaxID=179855 RepID=A0A9P6EF05_9AGAR|nr:MED7 protein-domain-containing protein [Crepidotus variabilis]